MAIIETEQSRELKLTQIERGSFVFRFASYRKQEDAKLNLRSEDFIVADITPSKASFVLCDGVGSSFYGDLGSQILSEVVLHYLQSLRLSEVAEDLKKNQSSSLNLVTDLRSALDSSLTLAQKHIDALDIRTGKSEMVYQAEIEQKDLFGSQSNFAAGVIWPRSSKLPNGLALFLWLGNARLRLFSGQIELPALAQWGKDVEQQKDVWSSKHGLLGNIYSYVTDLTRFSSVIAYSDGLETVESAIKPGLTATEFETLVGRAQALMDDDISYLELTPMTTPFARPKDDISNAIRAELSERKKSSIISERDFNNTERQSLLDEIKKLTTSLGSIKHNFESKMRSYKKALVIAPILALLFGCLLGYSVSLLKTDKVPTSQIITAPPVVITVIISPTDLPSLDPGLELSPTPLHDPSQALTPTYSLDPSQVVPTTSLDSTSTMNISVTPTP